MGAAHDRFEQEADQIAEQVVSQSTTPEVQRQPTTSPLSISKLGTQNSIQPKGKGVKNFFRKIGNLFKRKKTKGLDKGKQKAPSEITLSEIESGDDLSMPEEKISMGESNGELSGESTSESTSESEYEAPVGTPDWSNRQLMTMKPTRHVFTIAVARQNPEYLTFAKARAKSTRRNFIRSAFRKLPGVRNAKSSKQIKEKAARVTVQQRGPLPEGQTFETEVQKVIQGSDKVGHTWVKFTSYVGDKVQAIYTYGFYPADNFVHPGDNVRGVVNHPDSRHDVAMDEERIDDRNDVEGKKFNKGIERAEKIRAKPPTYKLAGYNCTSFAKHISGVVGVSFPNAGTLFPAKPLQGFVKRLQNPNKLYESLQDKVGTSENGRTVVNESEEHKATANERIIQQQEERQQAINLQIQEMEKATPYEISDFSAIFFGGTMPGNGDYIQHWDEKYGVDLRVTSTTPTTFHNPEEDMKPQEFLPCLVRYEGSGIQKGWMRVNQIKPKVIEEESVRVRSETESEHSSSDEMPKKDVPIIEPFTPPSHSTVKPPIETLNSSFEEPKNSYSYDDMDFEEKNQGYNYDDIELDDHAHERSDETEEDTEE